MLQRVSLFSLNVRVFYGDGERRVKVKIKVDDFARAFESPTKIIEVTVELSKDLILASSSKNQGKMITISKLYN
ncbi:MAG: hypothetical protein EAX91_16965 [Candidatus Lokiarchaeota archaeon]|nr:hypothetical protein [Candidatus Lokiarchaeota archaeon]